MTRLLCRIFGNHRLVITAHRCTPDLCRPHTHGKACWCGAHTIIWQDRYEPHLLER